MEIIENRVELLSLLPKYGNVAELGVFEGAYAQKILRYNDPWKLYLIDPWGYWNHKSASYHAYFNDIIPKFIDDDTARIVRKSSLDASVDFPDDFFSWVYIDSTKKFEYTMDEIKAYYPKVKEGGFICGHDYMLPNEEEGDNLPTWIYKEREFSKVKEAVTQILEDGELDLEFKYLTNEFNGNGCLSYALQKSSK